MKSRKNLLKESRLYLILDKKASGNKSLVGIAKKCSASGADIIQLRDKTSDRELVLKEAFLLRKTLRNSDTLLIVNDYLDAAKIAQADGVHLGQEDTSVTTARRILGKDKIIGVSCHNLSQALKAQKNGADYIGIGPIFSTPTKPEYKAIGLKITQKLKDKMRIPFFAIGDINSNNISQVISRGAKRVALCRAIVKTKHPELSTKFFSDILH